VIRRWNEKELSILKEHGSTMLVRELMEVLPDRTVRSIRYKMRNLGITLTADTRQRMHGSVYGVGINDLVDDPNYHTAKYDYSSQGKKRMVWKCPFYQRWKGMLYRCYTSKYAPAYEGCTVSEEWHLFSTFKKWMESRSWEGKHLDKDILVPGNKVYGEDTCLFVSRKLNNLLHIQGKGGEYPQGVHLKSSSTSYIAECYRDGKSNYLGSFATVEEASSAYIKYKRAYILEVADNLTEDDTSDVDRTRKSLRMYAAQSGWTPPA